METNESNELDQTNQPNEAPAPAPEAPAPAPAPVESKFTGGAFANLGINFVTFFVSLITLGIARPFLLCWKMKWVAKNTIIDGRKMTFDGNGGQLLGNYIKWILLSIITIGIYAIFCMPLNMNRWHTKHLHFEGEEAVESKFDGSVWGLFGTNWVANFVTIITLSFGSYWAHCYKERWYARHTIVSGHKLMFDGKGMQYFGKCFVWTLLMIVTIGIYGIWRAVKVENWTVSYTHIAG